MRQLHLHIDDPTTVIPQNRGEQARRDSNPEALIDEKATGAEELRNIGFLLPITVPWSTLVGSRKSRDAVCSLHLFCRAVAATELAEKRNLEVEVFIYGGCFSFKSSCIGMSAHSLIPELALRTDTCENPRGEKCSFSEKKANMATSPLQGRKAERLRPETRCCQSRGVRCSLYLAKEDCK